MGFILLHYTALVSIILLHLALFASKCQSLAIEQSVPQQAIDKIKNTLSDSNDKANVTTRKFDQRRPIWNLAHMVNSIKELEYRLLKGANAIEVDVTFSREGKPLYTYHGPPCDCWRHCHQQENFDDYLMYLSDITSNYEESSASDDSIGRNLSLLFLDLKLDSLDHDAKVHAGSALARSLRDNLFFYVPMELNSSTSMIKRLEPSFTTPIKVILSINHVSDVELVHNFIYELEQSNSSAILDRIGFDVGMNDDIHQIESMWSRYGKSLHLWQGDGYTNCISPFYNLERLSRALSKRNQATGYPRKVYHWTIDLHDRIRESLRLGVDAIMTNHPERLIKILEEPEMVHNYRLATRDDDPFLKIPNIGRYYSETARYQRSAGSPSGGFFAGLMDVVSSWITYIKEIPFLSLPTTSRFLPKVKRHRQASSGGLGIKSRSELDPSLASNLSVSNTFSQTNQLDHQQDETAPYEGPKWYTSLASNLLVSLMKLVLPTKT